MRVRFRLQTLFLVFTALVLYIATRLSLIRWLGTESETASQFETLRLLATLSDAPVTLACVLGEIKGVTTLC